MLENAERVQDIGAKRDDLHIRLGTGHAHQLRPDLVELAEAAFLRALIAEHRPRIEQLERQMLVEAARDQRAGYPGGVLRPQRDLLPAPVDEGVHLLRDNVRVLPDRPFEHFGELEDRCLDLAEAIAGRHCERCVDDMAVAAGRLRKQIVGASDGLQTGHGVSP